mgnify:CR=1 FL=1
MKAVDTFDSDRRARFSTYASRCIENEIRMQFRRNRKTGGTVSLQEALESDGDSALTLADVLQDSFCMEDTCETQDDIRRMRQLLDGLPARERQIILLRYGLSGQPPLTQLETAKAAGHQPQLCFPSGNSCAGTSAPAVGCSGHKKQQR